MKKNKLKFFEIRFFFATCLYSRFFLCEHRREIVGPNLLKSREIKFCLYSNKMSFNKIEYFYAYVYIFILTKKMNFFSAYIDGESHRQFHSFSKAKLAPTTFHIPRRNFICKKS